MTLERSTVARLTTAAVLLLVLGAGVVLGIALDRQLGARGVTELDAAGPVARPGQEGRRRGFDPRARGPGEERDSTRRRPSLIVEEVGLSEEQRAQADSIYWLYRGRMRALHEEFDAAYTSRFEEIMSQSREDMLSILTVEQRATYDSLLSVWDQRRRGGDQDSIQAQGEDSGEG